MALEKFSCELPCLYFYTNLKGPELTNPLCKIRQLNCTLALVTGSVDVGDLNLLEPQYGQANDEPLARTQNRPEDVCGNTH